MKGTHASRPRRHSKLAQGVLLALSLAAAQVAPSGPPIGGPTAAACAPLRLAVQMVGPAPTAYREFCRANPPDCDLRGPSVLAADDTVCERLRRVNVEVNDQVRFVPDMESTGYEEVWRYPVRGRGDCEDNALEKRRRLVAAGLSSAALTMAIVHHRARKFSHAVLLAETAQGTLILDSLTDELLCWSRAPYNFESRERIDGRWDRFDQSIWVHEHLPTAPEAAPCVSAPR